MVATGPDVDLAIKQFGEPNWSLSSDREIRFGSNGSVSFDRDKGAWFNHETDEGGYLEEDAPAIVTEFISLVVQKYDYRDADGDLKFQVQRFMPKDFRPRVPNGNGGWYSGKGCMDGVEMIPYRLPEMLDADEVILVEGEKDVDALIDAGFVATTKSGGSGGWKPELNKYFEGKNIIVIPDNDDAGRKTARNSASALVGVAASVRFADICAGLQPKADVSDYLEANSVAELQDLLEKAPVYVPEKSVSVRDVFKTLEAKEIEAVIAADDFVEELLISGQMSVVYGPSGCGKTFFAADLALHVAHGRSWRGRDVTQGGVLYIAAEGAYGIRNRIVAFQNHFGGDAPPLAVLPTSVNFFDSEEDIERLIATIEAKAADYGGVSLVVVDTLARVLAGGNENSGEDMGALIANTDRIREVTSAHVMLIHHTGKDEARGARGHSSLRAATDTEVEISKSDLGAIARVTKQRELEMEGEFGFELETVELGVGPRGKPITSCIVRPAELAGERKLRRPRYSNQKLVWKVMLQMKKAKTLSPMPHSGFGIMIDGLFEKCKGQFVCDAKHKRDRFEKAVEGLMGDGYIEHEDGWVWLK